MRDYEMVELKLSVALEEGTAAKGLVHSTGQVGLERIMPGLYVIQTPIGAVAAHLVIMTDDFDLTLLGFPVGDAQAAIVLHRKDMDTLAAAGIAANLDGFEERASLQGWHFRAFAWGTIAAIDAALRQLLPAYQPQNLPDSLPLDC